MIFFGAAVRVGWPPLSPADDRSKYACQVSSRAGPGSVHVMSERAAEEDVQGDDAQVDPDAGQQFVGRVAADETDTRTSGAEARTFDALAPPPNVWPTLRARNPRSLIRFLVDALGFEETVVYG